MSKSQPVSKNELAQSVKDFISSEVETNIQNSLVKSGLFGSGGTTLKGSRSFFLYPDLPASQFNQEMQQVVPERLDEKKLSKFLVKMHPSLFEMGPAWGIIIERIQEAYSRKSGENPSASDKINEGINKAFRAGCKRTSDILEYDPSNSIQSMVDRISNSATELPTEINNFNIARVTAEKGYHNMPINMIPTSIQREHALHASFTNGFVDHMVQRFQNIDPGYFEAVANTIRNNFPLSFNNPDQFQKIYNAMEQHMPTAIQKNWLPQRTAEQATLVCSRLTVENTLLMEKYMEGVNLEGFIRNIQNQPMTKEEVDTLKENLTTTRIMSLKNIAEIAKTPKTSNQKPEIPQR
ncbi:MAG: hypothetical protein IPP74_12150 [Alphaproteobacteria bacterium]|nr:hypothetical protein [Alphaproteobacteria bacterium]